MKRVLVIAIAAALLGWLGFGAFTLHRRAPRLPMPPGEIRGAWHVHTTWSDGLGSPGEVVAAAKAAGLQFVVLADHNALVPAEAGYRDGVLVVTATEISSAYGHVVAIGLPGSPGEAEKADPLGRVAAAGGAAVLAHPIHPRRPFTGWSTGGWSGFEAISNDSFWYQALRDRSLGRIALAALALPFDPVQTVLWISRRPVAELARFDAEADEARRDGRPLPAFLCSADAHGYPSYRAAFEAFSMHVPVALTGDAVADTKAVVASLLDGRATCVFDGVAPASRVRVDRLERGGIAFTLETPETPEASSTDSARVWLLRDGKRVEPKRSYGGGKARFEFCEKGCVPGTYRIEATFDGRAWIFTNPFSIE